MTTFTRGDAIKTVGAIATLGLAGAIATKATPAAAAGAAQTVYIFRGESKIMGPDGNHHDTVVPSSFVAKVGQPLTLTVINLDEGPHTFTSPELDLNATVAGGKEVGDKVEAVTTTFTFTPSKKGNFRWFCAVPCDKGGKYWAMSKDWDGAARDGYMAGMIIVI